MIGSNEFYREQKSAPSGRDTVIKPEYKQTDPSGRRFTCESDARPLASSAAAAGVQLREDVARIHWEPGQLFTAITLKTTDKYQYGNGSCYSCSGSARDLLLSGFPGSGLFFRVSY
jgi:hypothetical protein